MAACRDGRDGRDMLWTERAGIAGWGSELTMTARCRNHELPRPARPARRRASTKRTDVVQRGGPLPHPIPCHCRGLSNSITVQAGETSQIIHSLAIQLTSFFSAVLDFPLDFYFCPGAKRAPLAVEAGLN